MVSFRAVSVISNSRAVGGVWFAASVSTTVAFSAAYCGSPVLAMGLLYQSWCLFFSNRGPRAVFATKPFAIEVAGLLGCRS